jgi:hypothetical protein
MFKKKSISIYIFFMYSLPTFLQAIIQKQEHEQGGKIAKLDKYKMYGIDTIRDKSRDFDLVSHTSSLPLTIKFLHFFNA